MGYVTPKQIERAKAVNIEDYILSHEPHNIKRIGHTIYLKDHDSLRISNGLWKWESQGIGGKNVVDYLIKVRGYEFTDAVRHFLLSVLVAKLFCGFLTVIMRRTVRRFAVHIVVESKNNTLNFGVLFQIPFKRSIRQTAE